MIDFESMNGALSLLTSSGATWLIVIPGILIGLVAGATPGMQISMAMAILLPTTLYMDFLQAILFLTAIFTGGTFGSSVPAILMNIPGSSSAVATAFDGYPMTRRGQHNEALGIALAASCVGTLFGYAILLFLIAPLSVGVLKLGPSELLMVVLWGISLIALLSGDKMSQGLLVGIVGLLAGTVGMSPTGSIRGTAGIADLLDGIPVIPAMIGLFAASELLAIANQKFIVEDDSARALSFKSIWKGFLTAFRYPVVILRGGVIGSLIGAVPGIGSSVSNLVSYAETKRNDPNPESFGQGNPKGVAASESANSSSEGGSMVTLLALGIPGGGGTAIMLAAFNMHNIVGGPQFIRDHTDIVYSIILVNFAQAAILIVLGLGMIHLLSSVVKVPIRVLLPSVLVLAVFGAFALSGSMAGPLTVLIFGFIGWWLKRYGYPIPPVVIGLLLGGMAEGELIRSYQISGGHWEYFAGRPMTLILFILLIASLAGKPLVQRFKARTTS